MCVETKFILHYLAHYELESVFTVTTVMCNDNYL